MALTSSVPIIMLLLFSNSTPLPAFIWKLLVQDKVYGSVHFVCIPDVVLCLLESESLLKKKKIELKQNFKQKLKGEHKIKYGIVYI